MLIRTCRNRATAGNNTLYQVTYSLIFPSRSKLSILKRTCLCSVRELGRQNESIPSTGISNFYESNSSVYQNASCSVPGLPMGEASLPVGTAWCHYGVRYPLPRLVGRTRPPILFSASDSRHSHYPLHERRYPYRAIRSSMCFILSYCLLLSLSGTGGKQCSFCVAFCSVSSFCASSCRS